MKAARALLFTVALLLGARLDAQQYFGMNQVQYKHFDWRVIETEHFLIHYYPEERAGAMDAARLAERSYARLSKVLDHQFREKKPIILFASRSEFGQNNVTGDLGEGTGGVTEALRHRLILPLTGDLGSFDRVLSHEMVHEFQFDIFARGKAGANLQTLSQVDPPLWFMEGMAEYLSIGPVHPLTASWLRDAAVNGNLPSIEQMTERPDKYFPYRYGEGLWEYIGERWGDAAIGEILQNATTLGIARAFQRQLGLTLHELSNDWRESVSAKYLPQAAMLDRPRTSAQPLLTEKRSGGQIFLAPSLSSDGNRIAFLSNGNQKRGELFIDLWLADAHTGKRIKRLVESTLNPNFEELRLLYSQSSFSNDGRTLAFTAQREGKDVLYLMDVAKASVRARLDLPVDAVWSPVWSPDDKQIAFSGSRGGMTDLYIVNADGKGLRQLTNDAYGDLQPAWSPDGRRIAFATDRGTGTDLSILKFSRWRIAVMDAQSGAIEVLPNQAGLNLNPQWSPDGGELAFISDRTGIPNVFLYDFATQQHYQITNVLGGVSAITEYSPAISWARGADRMAFTYFERGDYTVWAVDNPRGLKKTAFRPTGTNLAVGATPADSPTVPKTGFDSLTLRPRTGEPTSTYRAPAGSRQSSLLPAQETVADLPQSVAALNSDPLYGLPDTTRFKERPYKVAFHPDYIANPSVGYTPSYGGRFAGGTAFVFSDLLGNHQLALAGNVYGRLSDASAFVGYANLSHRLQYTTGISQDPIYVPISGGQTQGQQGVVRFQTNYLRYVVRNLFISAQYPLNRFTRFETGVQMNSISQGFVQVYQDCNQAGFCTGVQFQDTLPQPTINYATPSVAFVSDNTLFGTTGPVIGRRMRFQASQNVGKLTFSDFLVDYRRYDPIIFNTLTFATRFLSSVSVGPNEGFFPKYIGRPNFIRGYDRANFSFVDCTSIIGNGQSQCNNAQLAGSRVAVANAELRFPIIRRFDVGSNFGLPPVDGLIFYDAGLAWSKNQTPHLGRAPADNDPNINRYPLTSWGAGLRVNLFNLAILRWDYARPLSNDRKPNWTFSLGASY
jgi:hypothetical protein